MIRYLALGDSYTIGEAVEKDQSFPHQLLHGSNAIQLKDDQLKIIAVTGWTTNDLLQAIKKENPKQGIWSFITLLIGVNNQYQGLPTELYEKEFEELLSKAIQLMNGQAQRVVVISIPDYGVTPFSEALDGLKISKEINQYNLLAEAKAKQAGANWVNITDVSLEAKDQPQLIACDGLHPSGLQYKKWVDKIYPVIKKIINNE